MAQCYITFYHNNDTNLKGRLRNRTDFCQQRVTQPLSSLLTLICTVKLMKRNHVKLTVTTLFLIIAFTAAPTTAAARTPTQQQIPDAVTRGVTWLASVQNQENSPFWTSFGQEYYESIEGLLDGGWGITLNDYGLPYPHSSTMDTAMAIIGFAFANVPGTAPLIETAADWLVENQNSDGSWSWEYIIASKEFQGLPNLVSTYMGTMGLMFASPFVVPEKAQTYIYRVADALNWIVGARNSEGVWGFSPFLLQQSDTLITGVTTSTLCLAKLNGLQVNGMDEAIEAGVNYILETQEKTGGWKNNRGSWSSWVQQMQGQAPRPYPTTECLIALLRFQTLVKAGEFSAGWNRQLQSSIVHGLQWVGAHNLDDLNQFKQTRDVVDTLVVFEFAKQLGAHISWQRYTGELANAVDWVINTQGDLSNPSDWGWGQTGLSGMDTIFDTAFAAASLAGWLNN